MDLGERNKNSYEEYDTCTLAKFKFSQFVEVHTVHSIDQKTGNE